MMDLFDAYKTLTQPTPCFSNPDLWYVEHPAAVEDAKRECGSCPIRIACLSHALKEREPFGVWGGELIMHGQIVRYKLIGVRQQQRDHRARTLLATMAGIANPQTGILTGWNQDQLVTLWGRKAMEHLTQRQFIRTLETLVRLGQVRVSGPSSYRQIYHLNPKDVRNFRGTTTEPATTPVG